MVFVYTHSMHKVSENPDAHIKSLPDGIREDVAELDTLIRSKLKGRSRTLWKGVFWGGSQQTIIGYGDYVVRRPRKEDVHWFVVGLAVQKNYISLYVNSTQEGTYDVDRYKEALGKPTKVSKSSISFKKLADLNRDTLIKILESAQTNAPKE